MKIIEKEKLIIRKSFKITFKNGEIWAEELDSLSIHTEVAKKKFLMDLEQIKKPSMPAYISINLNETLVDENFAILLVNGLSSIRRPIMKVVFIGLDRKARKIFDNLFRTTPHNFIYTSINDFEKAKEWLIN